MTTKEELLKTKDELQEKLNKLDEQIKNLGKSSKRWKPEEDKEYWRIDTIGDWEGYEVDHYSYLLSVEKSQWDTAFGDEINDKLQSLIESREKEVSNDNN